MGCSRAYRKKNKTGGPEGERLVYHEAVVTGTWGKTVTYDLELCVNMCNEVWKWAGRGEDQVGCDVEVKGSLLVVGGKGATNGPPVRRTPRDAAEEENELKAIFVDRFQSDSLSRDLSVDLW